MARLPRIICTILAVCLFAPPSCQVLGELEDAGQVEALVELNHSTIFDSPRQMVLGNAEGSITLVEFFDYNCPHCRRAAPQIAALIEANPDLRLVMKELAILSRGSVEAARVSVAVGNIAPERYLDFHLALFARPGPASADKALGVARELGLDVAALTNAASSDQVTQNIAEVRQLASTLGVSAIPFYVIGNTLVHGDAGYLRLQSMITAMRKCGATAC